MTVAAIFIIMEVAALGMLKYNGILQDTWISRGVHGFMSTVWGGTESISRYFRLNRINEELAEENALLLRKLREYGHISMADKLEDGTSAYCIGNYMYIPAAITKAGNSRQHSYLIINKGSMDGIKAHSGIVTRNGVIGIVDAVSQHYSYARAFTNADMAVSARIGKDGAVGALRWNGRDTRSAILGEIPQHIEVVRGDTVYTSGYSAIFPPDIPIGTIETWKTINGATYEIDILMFTDFSKVRYVTVTANLDKEELKELETR
ncbi:MAG: rod shape-determining protein MreC [Bacteroidales bacterium]|nr:rod shape-determining protein MreC [Bacteroides sp.]MCM1197988.1 rod shape-determining protein MreC [Clostridium sp.]MCM1502143.1 rod shape-determining protein MreC [Bacteroidales bacterium]